MGATVGGCQLRCYITGRQLIVKSFAQDRPSTKICLAPSTSWSLVLKIKNLLNDGLNLSDSQGTEKSGASGLSGRFKLPIAVFAGERANDDIYQELLRQHVVPWVQRDVA